MGTYPVAAGSSILGTMNRLRNPPEDFGLRRWADLRERLLNPPRPRLDECLERATEYAVVALRRAAEEGYRVERVAERRAALQRDDVIESVWETLAPPRWVGDDARAFAGPMNTTRDRRGKKEDWTRVRAFPFRVEDAVACASDPEGIESCEALADEARARASQLGWGTSRRRQNPAYVWWSVDPRYLHIFPPIFLSNVFARAMAGVAGQASDFTHPAYDPYVVEIWQEVDLDRLSARDMPGSALREARRLLGVHAMWARASASGAEAKEVARGRGALRSFRNPFEPLVQVLLRGYLVLDILPGGPTHLLFPRLDVASIRTDRRRRRV